jgi:hypothetical protein
MSAAAAGHLQQQQQQQQQRAVMQQGTPTEKRSRWMAENYSQNIYAVSHRKTSDNKTKRGAVLIKLYFIHNLQMGPISESVCLSQAFPAYSLFVGKARSLSKGARECSGLTRKH